MMNFAKLDWKRFQDLCADLLEAEGYKIIRRSGIGPERGRDILVQKDIEYGPNCSGPFTWLVQCKHKAGSGKPVYPKDIEDFIGDVPIHAANGFFLITDTHLSTKTEERINGANESSPYRATYWDIRDLENKLLQHRLLKEKYFGIEKETGGKKKDWYEFNPFRELFSYTEQDKDYFFGRQQETIDLLERVYKFNVIGLFGESGTGKTSLLNAGVIPRLRDEKFLIVYTRCLDEPTKRIKEKIIRALEKGKVEDGFIKKLESKKDFSGTIKELQSLCETLELKIVIIVDQFEELFTRARGEEQKQLSNGLLELISNPTAVGRVVFVPSLREDYIGHLWEWSYKNKIQDIWINTYRIKRLDNHQAKEVIVNPLKKVGIDFDNKLISKIIKDLLKIGDGEVYPPYLQITCFNLYEELKRQHGRRPNPTINVKLYDGLGKAENIVSKYLDEKLLEDLDAGGKYLAQNILDALTGSEGLRTLLTVEEIVRYTANDKEKVKNVLEHLIKRRVVRVVTEGDVTKGYELVHDFLSRKFFEKLRPEAKMTKMILDMFRPAFRDWKQYGVLASKDRMEIFYEYKEQLPLGPEETEFLLRSSFEVYWWGGNEWWPFLNKETVIKVCLDILSGEKPEETTPINHSIQFLGGTKDKKFTPLLIEIINAKDRGGWIRETAIEQFGNLWPDGGIHDERVVEPLLNMLEHEKAHKLRKVAVDTLSQYEGARITEVIVKALYDVRAPVRAEAALALGRRNEINATHHLIEALDNEFTVKARRNMIEVLGKFSSDPKLRRKIRKVLKTISENPKEDHRHLTEARYWLKHG